MSRGRPRTALGTFGHVRVTDLGGRYRALTRFRDLDGRLRKVTATARSPRAAEALLKERLLHRTGYGLGGLLSLSGPFSDLAELWLADLALRDIAENTKENYRDDLRLHVRPFFEHYTLGGITTGRVEWFLKSERAVSYSRAKHSRTVLSQLFTFALRNDAMTRNPVEGTSPLAKPKHHVRALTLRPCDVVDGKRGMVAHGRGIVVYRQGKGTFRQDHPKTDASVRQVPVPEFAAEVLRRRLANLGPEERDRTIFANRAGGPLSQYNFRRTFREFLVLAGLEESGITPRWYRRTGATVLARGLGVDAAAAHLGHTSKAITEGHYVEPDRTIDFEPAMVLEATLRPVDPDGGLLARPETSEEDELLDSIDSGEEEAVEVA